MIRQTCHKAKTKRTEYNHIDFPEEEQDKAIDTSISKTEDKQLNTDNQDDSRTELVTEVSNVIPATLTESVGNTTQTQEAGFTHISTHCACDKQPQTHVSGGTQGPDGKTSQIEGQ